MEIHCTTCCGAEKGFQVSTSAGFNKIVIPFSLVGYKLGFNQFDATCLFGYLPSHIQHVLMEELLSTLGNLMSVWDSAKDF